MFGSGLYGMMPTRMRAGMEPQTNPQPRNQFNETTGHRIYDVIL